ncbi:MAG: hypothetical protein WD048_08105 [Chitinophagales bacterium]
MTQNKDIKKLLERTKAKAPKSGLTVPGNYFEQLQERVMQNVLDQNTTKVVPIAHGPGKNVAALLIAASFATVLFLVNMGSDKIKSENPVLMDYTTEVINDYLEKNTSEIELMAYADEIEMSLIANNDNELSGIQSKMIGDFLMSESDESDLGEFYDY